MKELFQYIQNEWPTISAAPFTFTVIFALAFALAYAASKWKHGANIDSLRERLAAKTQELETLQKQSPLRETREGGPSILPPKIEIRTGRTAPYHVVTTDNGYGRNVVAVGVANVGGQTLSNCKVYLERIVPPLDARGSSSLLLDGGGFQLRHDDPEKLIEIAHRWEHHTQSRFSVPQHGAFFDTRVLLDESVRLKFAVRVAAQECERSAVFEMWTDESGRLRLEFLNYSS